MTDDQAAQEVAAREELESRLGGWWPKHWAIRTVIVLTAVGVVVAGGLALVDRFGTDERSTDGIAREIEDWAQENGTAGAVVTCPDPVEWRVGETFHCVLKVRKQSARVEVTMENDAGDVTWQAQ